MKTAQYLFDQLNQFGKENGAYAVDIKETPIKTVAIAKAVETENTRIIIIRRG